MNAGTIRADGDSKAKPLAQGSQIRLIVDERAGQHRNFLGDGFMCGTQTMVRYENIVVCELIELVGKIDDFGS